MSEVWMGAGLRPPATSAPRPGAFGLQENDTIIKLSLFNELTNSRLLARRGL